MDNVAFSFGNITIYWYSIMILLGIFVALFVTFREIKRQNISQDFYTNLIFYVILFGIVGARAYYVLFNLDYYLKNPAEIFQVWHGGLAIHGGIIAGILVIVIYTKKYRAPLLKILDITAVGLIIAQSIGRWGNFFNQEAFGRLTTRAALKAQYIPEFIIERMNIGGNYYQPTFFYESVWNLLGFFVMLILRRRKYNKVGEMTGFYFVWYSVGRFVVEGMRSDSLMLGNFRVAQIVSVILFAIGIVIIVINKRGSHFDRLYNAKGEKDEIRF